VLGARIPPYEEALRDFRAHLARLPAAGPKAIQPDTFTELNLAEAGRAGLLLAVATRRPDLVLALGRSALTAAAGLADRADLPVLYLLAPAAEPLVRGHPNVTGVDLDVPPAATLKALHDVLPGIRRVGVVHDPAQTADLVREAARAAGSAGLSLAVLPVGSAREAAARLEELAGRVDALWLLPDLTMAVPEVVQSLLLFSLRHRVPVLAFFPSYLERGATLAVSADPEAMAAQAARMARRLLAGAPPAGVPAEPPSRIVVTVNRAVAAKLGVEPNRASPQTLEWAE